jgi:hypothetical protein
MFKRNGQQVNCLSLASAFAGFLHGLHFFMKMEVIFSSETSGSLQTTWRYNPEDHTLHIHFYQTIKCSNKLLKLGFGWGQ